MYVVVHSGLGDAPSREPWRARVGLRPKPQALRFMNLDQFRWNEASLTARLRLMVGHLAKHVRLSWQSMQPIGVIYLVGHTDTTGPEKYNINLGDRRAQAVKNELENILKEDILKGRIQIAIYVDPSPGVSAPTTDNKTREGRARNRRVEVFIAPLEPLTVSDKPIPIPKVTGLPPGSVIVTTPDHYGQRSAPKLPPGKSFKQFVDDWLSDHNVPKILRDKIWGAIFGKNFGLVSSLLDAAGISGPEKEAFVETARVLAEAPTR